MFKKAWKYILNKVALVASVAGLALPVVASATYLDPTAASVVSTIVSDAGTVMGYGWTILGAIFGGLILIGVFKAYARKGAGR